jgi:3-phenylpropionate/trans-cinnamate dioxygenase ferredoxin reductase component
MADFQYLVVGGGMTADAAVQGIREVDPTGSIALYSTEPDPPYARPPLSKGLWQGRPLEEIWRGTERHGVELRLGRRVARLDLAAHSVVEESGARASFGKVLLATGGRPRRLNVADDGIIYFRTVADFRRLHEFASPGRRVAIVGGGFIGSEVAAALAGSGCAVTMLFPEAGIGARTFPAELALQLNEYFRERGVEVLAGEKVGAVERDGDRHVVRTAGGAAIAADAVVAGLGLRPNDELAGEAGLAVADGIVVDSQLRAGRDDVFAAGDVARFPSALLGGTVRVEHEDNALTQGRHAGRAMAGQLEPYTHLPFFYSDLFDLGYEAVGDLDSRLEVVADWREPLRQGILYYLGGSRVRGVLLWGIFGRVDEARALIAEPGPFTARDVRGRL